MILDVLTRLHRYDPNRSQLRTFVTRLVNNRVATILEGRRAGIQKYLLCDSSSIETLADEQGDQHYRTPIITQKDYFEWSCSRQPIAEQRALREDLRKIILRFPPHLREICCRLLSQQTIAEISREMKIPRGTIYDYLKRLQHHFKDAGLHEYL
jgi:RNA polymerase sigma-70 factor (ECF subfamily)